MRVLAVDTSHRGERRAPRRGRPDRFHPARTLVRPISSISRDRSPRSSIRNGGAGLALDRVAIVTGPGSFTGLRIGMAFVKGLYAALGCDLVTMTSLELLSRQALAAGLPVAAMIDARKDEVYAALLRQPDGRETISPRAVAPAAFLAALPAGGAVFIGSGALRYRDLVTGVFGPARDDSRRGRSCSGRGAFLPGRGGSHAADAGRSRRARAAFTSGRATSNSSP